MSDSENYYIEVRRSPRSKWITFSDYYAHKIGATVAAQLAVECGAAAARVMRSDGELMSEWPEKRGKRGRVK